ncbi:MAG TPA: MmcQ/YjbR family DNA-binding protein [Actinomycetota bacterium]|nr:MmcQ/YjbR family DNA-binding protein [Actinomycetota bacterium]
MQARTVRRLALELPEAEERETWGTPTFRVHDRIFAMFAESEREVWVKSTHDEQRALIAMDPETFFHPAYVGPSGWVGVRFRTADRGELRELMVEAWRLTAPKRLVKAFDETGGA